MGGAAGEVDPKPKPRDQGSFWSLADARKEETKAFCSAGVACGEWVGEEKAGGKAFKERKK